MEPRDTARLAFPGQEFDEHLVQLRLIETAVDLAVMGDADQTRLLAHDQDDGIALHGESERRTMSRPHPAHTGQRLCKREDTPGSDDAALTNDDGAVVER